jgi:hypothetical protein
MTLPVKKYQNSPIGTAFRAVISFVFSMVFTYHAIKQADGTLWLGIGAGFFFFLSVMGWRSALSREPALVISEKGISHKGKFFPWKDVKSYQVVIEDGNRTNDYHYLSLRLYDVRDDVIIEVTSLALDGYIEDIIAPYAQLHNVPCRSVPKRKDPYR